MWTIRDTCGRLGGLASSRGPRFPGALQRYSPTTHQACPLRARIGWGGSVGGVAKAGSRSRGRYVQVRDPLPGGGGRGFPSATSSAGACPSLPDLLDIGCVRDLEETAPVSLDGVEVTLPVAAERREKTIFCPSGDQPGLKQPIEVGLEARPPQPGIGSCRRPLPSEWTTQIVLAYCGPEHGPRTGSRSPAATSSRHRS